MLDVVEVYGVERDREREKDRCNRSIACPTSRNIVLLLLLVYDLLSRKP